MKTRKRIIKAVVKGYADVVKLLLEYGADPTIRHKGGKTPIDLAIESGYHKIAQILISYAQSTRRRSRRRKASPA